MKNLITIGLPSKGRLKDKAVDFLDNKGLKVLKSDKERNYFASIENKSNIKIIYLHAKEIIQRLGDGTLDIGISGLDLLKESEKNLQDKITIKQKLNFGEANLISKATSSRSAIVCTSSQSNCCCSRRLDRCTNYCRS